MANLERIAYLAAKDGVVPVDKPAGVPFQEVVQTVKRRFNLAKVGHGGSLEAAASGVFLVLLGDASRVTQHLMCADREYEAELRLGIETDTADTQGRVLRTAAVEAELVDVDRIRAVLDSEFRGDVFESKPRFSAILRNGSTSYEIVETDAKSAPRLVHYYRIAVASWEPPVLKLSRKCGKDASPRALAGALGKCLGCGAVLCSLRRTSFGRFSADCCFQYEKLLTMNAMDFAERVIPVPEAVGR